MYNDAGVNIHIHKIGFGQSDEEIDFNFQVAKALGCVGITTERSEALAKKLAPFADKHKIWVAFHNHTNNYPVMDKTDPILSYGQYIGFNFDVGHYFAGTKGLSPIPVIEKYHDRIVSLHLKDRTAEGGNLPWGQGKTPIKEILQLMRKEKWTFPADIELEYQDSARLKLRGGSGQVRSVLQGGARLIGGFAAATAAAGTDGRACVGAVLTGDATKRRRRHARQTACCSGRTRRFARQHHARWWERPA